MRDKASEYGWVSKSLHWLVAILILGMLTVGFVMESLPKTPLKWWLYDMHKSFGLTVLALMMLRLGWRIFYPIPQLPEWLPCWQKFAARMTHAALFLFGLAMPLSGWMMSVASDHTPQWFGLFVASLPIPKSKLIANFAHTTHGLLAWCFCGLILLHTSAAFWHGLGQDGMIWRMLGRPKK